MIKEPYIYRDAIYKFGKLVLTDIWSIPSNPGYYIKISALTPEYTEIFKQAEFLVNIPGLLKMMKILNPGLRKRFWKLFYEISETDKHDWKIGFRRMIKELGSYPVIEDYLILAREAGYNRNDLQRIESITFSIGDPRYFILSRDELPEDNNDYLIRTLENILTVAQKKGYKLEVIRELLNEMQNQTDGTKILPEDLLKKRVSEILELLHRWGNPEAIRYSMELQKTIFVS